MSSISLNSNTSSMRVLRHLAQSSRALGATFERLSSGLRINSAADDAAGLAVASGLNTDQRVFGQAIRNVNDGISLVSIAESAGQELGSMLTRIRELGTQAANGTLSVMQRRALDQEARALTDEYNRIVSSTRFNDLALLGGGPEVAIQLGYGAQNSLAMALGAELERNTGDGTYNQSTTAMNASGVLITADFDNDGVDDVLSTDGFGGSAFVNLSDGDGTFTTSSTFIAPIFYQNAAVDDFNNDGYQDIYLHETSGVGRAFLGDGDGTFTFGGAVIGIASDFSIEAGDFNGDGNIDLASTDGYLRVAFGNGDGTFQTAELTATDNAYTTTLVQGDFNGDGALDLVAGAGFGGAELGVMINNGDGSFTEQTIIRSGSGGFVEVIDANLDGFDDIIATNNAGELELFTSYGDGTFHSTQIAAGSDYFLSVSDINGDGLDDIIDIGSTTKYYLANGDGTFQSAITIGSNPANWATVGDFNDDGAADVILGGGATADVYLANAKQVTSLQYVNLLSQQSARESFEVIDTALMNLQQELGNLGSFSSRLASAGSSLRVMRDNLLNAESRIIDADVAAEAAELTRTGILQQAGAAVLAQANSLPALALLLLEG